jgi:hypothetical protein
MIKWFEGNPLALALGGICGFLLLTSLVLGVVWSLPPSVPDADGEGEEDLLALDIPELEENEPIETYAVITERPVFNESRLPAIEDETDGTGEEDLAGEEVDAPEFELAGVIMTPSIRMVTLRTKEQSESLVAFEGQPLEGNYGTWQVSRIEPRQITLASGRGEEVLLKLQVHDVAMTEPPKPVSPQKQASDAPAQAVADGDDDEPLSRAEEIRRRIAERREELRRAAEEESEGEISQTESREELRSMLTGVRQKPQNDEN